MITATNYKNKEYYKSISYNDTQYFVFNENPDRIKIDNGYYPDPNNYSSMHKNWSIIRKKIENKLNMVIRWDESARSLYLTRDRWSDIKIYFTELDDRIIFRESLLCKKIKLKTELEKYTKGFSFVGDNLLLQFIPR
jgi:hypothetical protein